MSLPLNIPVVTISSIDQADAVRAGREIDEVAFWLDPETPLADAEEIDHITRPRMDGFRLINKEVLDCKTRTKTALEKAYQDMCDKCLEDCDKEIRGLDIAIATLKQKIAIPNNQLQHIGPPREERNQGVQHVVKLPTKYAQYPSYEMGPDSIPFLPPFHLKSDKIAAIGRDQEAQKAWLGLNLVFLEERRQIVEDKKINLERRLKKILRNAVESRSLLGAGYLNYEFVI